MAQNVDYTVPGNVSFASINGEDYEQISSTEDSTEDYAAGPVGGRLSYNDSALDETIQFYRLQQRQEFDNDDSETNLTWTQSQIDNHLGVPNNWRDKTPAVFTYIDDANGIEKLRVPGSICHYSQNTPSVTVHAVKSQELMNTVTVRAEGIGMRVNSLKTQLLCMTAGNTSSNVSSYIKCGNQKITSSQELKILGFKFGTTPSVKIHVQYMVQKALRKLWTLRHVKKAGLNQSDMLKIFNTVIRPCVEYAVPTYHPMLTGELSDIIESVQKRACKLIFGWNTDYAQLVEDGRIETLIVNEEIN